MVNIPNEINAEICTNNCSLEGSTVVAFGMVGIVEEVDCLGNVMVARGSGVSDGQQFNFALTILDTGDAQDVYGYFATFPGSGNTFTAFNIVPGDEIVITPFGTSSQGVTTTSTSGTNKPDVVVDGTLIKVSTLKNKE